MPKPRIIEENIKNELCSYGCRQQAIVKFANGKFCCSTYPSSCDEVKKQNSEKNIGNNHPRNTGKTPWNKGLTAKDDIRIAHGDRSPYYGKRWGSGLTGHSKETKERLSEIMEGKMQNRYTASIRSYYNGIKMESSWEVLLAMSLDEHGIKWERPAPLKYLDDNNQIRRYYPDFYLPLYMVYLDPKNTYVQKRDERKLELVVEQNQIKLFVLNKNQLNWKVIESEVLR